MTSYAVEFRDTHSINRLAVPALASALAFTPLPEPTEHKLTTPSMPPSTSPPVHGILQGFSSYRPEAVMVPGPARILPSRTRANPSPARPLGVFCTNDFHPRTREPGPAAAHRISARTNSILAHPNPSAEPQRPDCTIELSRTCEPDRAGRFRETATVERNSQGDVDFRKPRSSFRCQADEAGSDQETDDACDGAREGYR